jgi:hypothetical protein
VAANKLSSKDRYKEDYKIVTDFVAKHPSPPASYYLTGHSLGSAIALQLRRDIPALNVAPGTAFNGALQPIDLLKPDARFHEVYASRDPLYLAEGHFYRNHEVKENPSLKPPSKWNLFAQAADKLANHKLSFFSSILGGSAWLHPSYARGGALAKAEAKPLSDSDLSTLLPGIKITSYPQLANMQSIDDALDSKGRGIILILTTGPSDGHWVGLLKSPAHKTIEYFDSYGNAPDYDLEHWVSPHKRAQLKENAPYLTQLLNKSQDDGDDVVWNRTKFQKDGGSISTCGRHVASRLLNADETLPVYTAMVRQSGMPPDEFVTVLTDKMLSESRAPRGAYASGGTRKRKHGDEMAEEDDNQEATNVEDEPATHRRRIDESEQMPDLQQLTLDNYQQRQLMAPTAAEQVLNSFGPEDNGMPYQHPSHQRRADEYAEDIRRRLVGLDTYLTDLRRRINYLDPYSSIAFSSSSLSNIAKNRLRAAQRKHKSQGEIDAFRAIYEQRLATSDEKDQELYNAENRMGATLQNLEGKYYDLRQELLRLNEKTAIKAPAMEESETALFPRNAETIQQLKDAAINKIRRLHRMGSLTPTQRTEADKVLNRLNAALEDVYQGADPAKEAETIFRLPEDVRGTVAEYLGSVAPRLSLGIPEHPMTENTVAAQLPNGLDAPEHLKELTEEDIEHLDPKVKEDRRRDWQRWRSDAYFWREEMRERYRPSLLTFRDNWNEFVQRYHRIPQPDELPRPWGGAGGGKPHPINTDAAGYDHISPRPVNSEYFHKHMPNVYLAQGIY